MTTGNGDILTAEIAALEHIRPLTPKEFADAIGDVRSPRWVAKQCRLGRLKTTSAGRPYLIHPVELARFRVPAGSRMEAATS